MCIVPSAWHVIYISASSDLMMAALVGMGEYLLRYNALARFSDGDYEFMRGICTSRTTTACFLGMFGATLYPIACFHILLSITTTRKGMRLITAQWHCQESKPC